MEFEILPVTAFSQNCSLITCPKTRRAAFIDPGGDIDHLEAVATEAGVVVEKILLTHGHIDHCGEAAMLARRLGVPIEGPHRDDDFWISQLPAQGKMFGFPPLEAFTPDRWLDDGDTVMVGEQALEVIHCPGHTPGHVVFFHLGERLAFVGDVLFAGSIGRTDFPRGNHADLIEAIKSRLFPLGDDIAFVPGHGPMSTFGEERLHNPFVRD
ncbi:MAG TPA: MBL fold metallo-hydrolase [Burkholderiaceae bacterium]|jgi:glyoxylase-like metal-dependent hydrolase (beta-lactamase superfamily II)|nr:MBL fold metallo-hydrolase [Burkholderiaceae bacterium]